MQLVIIMKYYLFLLAFHQTHPLPNESTIYIMFLHLMHLRLLLLLVAAIAFASPLLAPNAEYFGQGSIGPGPEIFAALDGDVYDGSADNYLDTSAVNLASTLIAQSEDEIPKDQFRKFKNTRCGGEDSVCCMGDRTYFSSGVGTAAWPCSMSMYRHRISFHSQLSIVLMVLLTHLPFFFVFFWLLQRNTYAVQGMRTLAGFSTHVGRITAMRQNIFLLAKN